MLSLLVCLSTALASQDVKLKAKDGTRLTATAFEGGQEIGVILVHGRGQTRAEWRTFAEKLEGNDVSFVAVDLREHGDSRTPNKYEPTTEDYLAMSKDVLAAKDWLWQRSTKEIICIGSDLGANLCLKAAKENSSIERLVLIGPGFNFADVPSIEYATRLGQRPMLLIFDDNDDYVAATIDVIEERVNSELDILNFPNIGRGARVLTREPYLEQELLRWIHPSLRMDVLKEEEGEETETVEP